MSNKIQTENNSVDALIIAINALLENETDPESVQRLAFALGLCVGFRHPIKKAGIQ